MSPLFMSPFPLSLGLSPVNGREKQFVKAARVHGLSLSRLRGGVRVGIRVPWDAPLERLPDATGNAPCKGPTGREKGIGTGCRQGAYANSPLTNRTPSLSGRTKSSTMVK